jgi:CDP-diacylglycerol--glycerol-3-phosphate 3-phosphatidyltransferase
MKIISTWLREPLERGLAPIAKGLIVARVHPNILTTLGFLALVASGVAFGYAHVRLGAALLLLSGVLDMLDGRVARVGGMMSRFGAFYDSTVDRLGEAALMIGITVFFMNGGVPADWTLYAVLASTIAMSTGLVVSYTRARAEGLMLECKVGLAQRAERVIGLGVPVLFFGAGQGGMLLLGIVVVLGLLSLVTVVQRIVHVHKQTRSVSPDASRPEAIPALADAPRKVRASE